MGPLGFCDTQLEIYDGDVGIGVIFVCGWLGFGFGGALRDLNMWRVRTKFKIVLNR